MNTKRLFTTFTLTAAAFATHAIGAAGEDTFKAKCAGCHGADGGGNTALGTKLKLRDLRSPEVQNSSDTALLGIIETGKPPMPAFGKTLDAPTVHSLVGYLRAIATK